MAWWLVFAVFLYLMCAVLLVAEVFVPSGGLLTVLAMSCLIGGGYIFFRLSTAAGVVGVVIAIVMIPAVLVATYRLLPRTRFGKNVRLQAPVRQQGDAVPDSAELAGLVGSAGVVVTPLRPVGTCNFSGRRVECVAESGYLDKGTNVKVIAVASTQVTVRKIEQS